MRHVTRPWSGRHNLQRNCHPLPALPWCCLDLENDHFRSSPWCFGVFWFETSCTVTVLSQENLDSTWKCDLGHLMLRSGVAVPQITMQGIITMDSYKTGLAPNSASSTLIILNRNKMIKVEVGQTGFDRRKSKFWLQSMAKLLQNSFVEFRNIKEWCKKHANYYPTHSTMSSHLESKTCPDYLIRPERKMF